MNSNSEYNEKLLIENGILVYDPKKVSGQEKNWLEENKIFSKSNYYLIMMEDTKSQFNGQTNIGTMYEFSHLVNSGNFNYDTAYIIENINLNGNKSNEWIPIGDETTPFEAILDGCDYIVSNVYLETDKSNQGLFGYNKGTIKNLKLEDLYIKSSNTSDAFVGGIVGYNNVGRIENCHLNNSQITGVGNDIGGIVGCNYSGTVNNCSNSATIQNTGNYATAGIVGWNVTGGTINNCINSGTITGNRYVGGIVGTNEDMSIVENSNNKGNIVAVSNYIDINGNLTSEVGGIAGISYYGSIKNSYNIGRIVGTTEYQGGITTYATRTISYEVSNCYYLNTTNSGGINKVDIQGVAEAKNSTDMKDVRFINLLNIENQGIWLQDTMNKNNGYPILSWQ